MIFTTVAPISARTRNSDVDQYAWISIGDSPDSIQKTVELFWIRGVRYRVVHVIASDKWSVRPWLAYHVPLLDNGGPEFDTCGEALMFCLFVSNSNLEFW